MNCVEDRQPAQCLLRSPPSGRAFACRPGPVHLVPVLFHPRWGKTGRQPSNSSSSRPAWPAGFRGVTSSLR